MEHTTAMLYHTRSNKPDLLRNGKLLFRCKRKQVRFDWKIQVFTAMKIQVVVFGILIPWNAEGQAAFLKMVAA
jgi:hypothetical protein